MEKVYFLLRDNVESGPFTRRQLLKQSLQPKDLIWEDGESVCWRHPSDLALGASDSASLKKTIVQPTSSQLFSVTPVNYAGVAVTSISKVCSHDGMRSSFIRLPGGGELELIVHKKNRKTVSWDGLLGVAFVTLLVAIAWYGRHEFFIAAKVPGAPVKPVATVSEKLFAKPKVPVTIAATMPAVENESITVNKKAETSITIQPIRRNNKAVQREKTPAVFEEARTEEVKTIPVTEAPVLPVEENPILQNKEVELIPPTAMAKPERETVTIDEPHKKKGLGKVLKDVFGKKKKPGEKLPSTQQP